MSFLINKKVSLNSKPANYVVQPPSRVYYPRSTSLLLGSFDSKSGIIYVKHLNYKYNKH